MRAFAFLAALFVLAALPVRAADTDLKNVPSGAYALDKSHASIVWRVSHFGRANYTGRFNDFDASLTFDSANPENSKLEVTILPNSVDTNNATLEEELRAEPYFNVIKFRHMTFRATKIERTGPTTGKVTGDFKMMGVTLPVTLNVTFNGWGEHFMKKKPVLGFSATGSLKRSLFGFTNGIPMVGDDVTFEIEVEFDKV